MSLPVPRIGRILDLVGLVLFLAGAGLYGWSWLGMRELQAGQPVSEDPTHFAAMARFNDLWELSRVGLGFMGAGAVIAVVALVVARRLGGGTGSP
ncbi:MAG: hypothetical protein GWM92_09270 [Gemmatimonadetes bacterium]|nr:hypothetical protein [Gemmatimonadota bacterium]NIR78847.1 hypothetical protein [Gemmatimonadota bacterium]NIT87485.1 hypothetical protein [Gemmatimonadota bacterium]NIU31344.1 hypothetical protein [Gemmatimonadota bacterium]NIU36032.1 hypothetical protein [Gemmatimonadota bacterium]